MGNCIQGAFSSDTTISTPVAINKGGTGQTTAQAALDALAAASGSLVQGDIFIVDSSTNLVRLARGSDNQTLVMNGSNPNWETVSAGDANLTYISQVTLGSANQNIGLSSGLDDYEWIMCFFHLRKSAVTNFTPEMQVYQGGSLTTGTSYSHNEVINGSSAKTNGASNVPVECGTTGNDFSTGTLMFNTGNLNNQGGNLIYKTGLTTNSTAADNSMTTWKMSGGNLIEGINFKQNVTDGTFGTTSKLEFVGIKEI